MYHLLKLVNLSDEEVSVAPSHFGVCNVDHILCEKNKNFILMSWPENYPVFYTLDGVAY